MLEIGNIVIYERSYKDLVIYFTSYIHSKSINLLRPYYQKLIRKTQKREWKKNDGLRPKHCPYKMDEVYRFYDSLFC